MKLLLCLLISRLLLSITTKTFFQPDEYFQSLEIAHRIYYGYGYLTWEWRSEDQLQLSTDKPPIRSVIYPFLYIPAYFITEYFNIEDITLLPKIFTGLLATIQDVALYKFIQYHFGNERAKVLILLMFTNIYELYTRHRSLSNTAETVITSIILYFWPLKKSRNVIRNFRLALVFAALAAAIRPTNVIIWIPFALHLLSSKIIPWKTAVINAFIIMILGFSIVVAVDSYIYGKLIITPIAFIQVNVLNSTSHFYGTSKFHYYISQAWPILLNTSIIYLHPKILRTTNVIERLLLVTIAFVTLVYSCLSHKEWRFLQPLLPLSQVIMTSIIKLRRNTIIWLMTGVIPALYLMNIHMSGQVTVTNWIRTSQDVTSGDTVAFFMPCHSTPWQSHIHRSDINITSIKCEPIGDYNEEEHFYNSPLNFLKNINELPSIAIIFEALFVDYPETLSYFNETNYNEINRLPNSIIHEDERRRGHIIILKKDKIK